MSYRRRPKDGGDSRGRTISECAARREGLRVLCDTIVADVGGSRILEGPNDSK